jgi:hypothetical protein
MNKPKRPWGLTLIATALIVLSTPLLLKGFNLAMDGKYAQSAGATMQGVSNIAAGVLVFMHHKFAVFLVGACAVFFTIACVVHGLSVIDILSVVLVWTGFSWYRSWRRRSVNSVPTAPSTVPV